MTFQMLGQEQILRTIRLSLKRGKATHAYLFFGPAGIGKKTLADYIARALNCKLFPEGPCDTCVSCFKAVTGVHPDIHWVVPDGKALKIDQIRQVKKTAALRPHESRCQVFILDATATVTSEAANSLLKILEEPTSETVFILLTENPGSLPPTVVSRCQRFALCRLDKEAMAQLLEKTGLAGEEMETVIRLAEGIPGKALAFTREQGWQEKYAEAADMLMSLRNEQVASSLAATLAEKDDLSGFLNILLTVLRDLLVLQRTGDLSHVLSKHHSRELTELTKKWTHLSTLEALDTVLALQKNLQSPVNVRLALERALRCMKEV